MFLLRLISKLFLFETNHKETSFGSDPGQGTSVICLNTLWLWLTITVQFILQFHPHYQKSGDNMPFLLTLACEEDKTSAISTISHHNTACKGLEQKRGHVAAVWLSRERWPVSKQDEDSPWKPLSKVLKLTAVLTRVICTLTHAGCIGSVRRHFHKFYPMINQPLQGSSTAVTSLAWAGILTVLCVYRLLGPVLVFVLC